MENLARWAAIALLVVASAWAGFLAYLAHHFAIDRPDNLEMLKVSLATVFVANYWPLFGAFSLTSFIATVYLVRKVHAPMIFCICIAASALLATFVMNVMVISAGFELSALVKQ